MEITYRGTPADDRIWKGTCHSCRSEAVAKQSEMHNITYDQRENCSFSWEVCPVCKAGNKSTGYGGMLFYLQK